ncbi:MAG: hypothetical protein QOF58_4033 [Pseudonocardiales bacterium]|jgi:hypothetical protein|nr:hypothetical protein [Pseudonocardiales bacterium]
MGEPVAAVIERLHRIDEELPGSDGAAVFNRVYLTVTEEVAAGLERAQVFRDPVFMTHLDVTFAGLWLGAYDATDHDVPKAWAALFERRHDRSVLPIQFALAGMNSHIAHDLPVAMVRTCSDLGASPHDAGVRDDYEKVNDLLAACEAKIRRSFLTEAAQAAEAHIGAVAHLISSWKIDRARDAAWVNVEALWSMRSLGALADRYRESLARTVGMTSRCLLTPLVAK